MSHYRFGKVVYHDNVKSFRDALYDFRSGTIPATGSLWQKVLALAFNKRSAYAYEQEWRAAIYQKRRPRVVGLDVPFDLDELFGDVYLGPGTSALERAAVSAVLKGARLAPEVRRSTLLDPPKNVKAGHYARLPERPGSA